MNDVESRLSDEDPELSLRIGREIALMRQAGIETKHLQRRRSTVDLEDAVRWHHHLGIPPHPEDVEELRRRRDEEADDSDSEDSNDD